MLQEISPFRTVLSELSLSLSVLILSGRLGIVDNDAVELNNMHRQVLVTILICT